MAEIPIQRKERRNWLPLLLGLLLIAALVYWFACRPRSTSPVAGGTDSAAVAGGAGTAGAAGDTSARRAGPVPADSAAATNTGGAPAVAGATGGGAQALVGQFVDYVQKHDTTQESEGNHVYTAEGTSRLAAALDGIAGGSPNIAAYADSMRRSIQRLRTSSPKDVHAEDAKAAFSAAVSAMDQIGRARNKANDVAPMRAIYNQLDPKVPLMRQLATVDRFFKAAADAIQKLS